MFTGIVTATGIVRRMARESGKGRLTVEAPELAAEVEVGDSVAVDGVCLTVTEFGAGTMTFDVVTETLSKSTLGDLATGSHVNLEGALRVGDRLSGHFVMGHVDGVGEVVERKDDPGQTVIRFRAPPPVAKYLLEKGSIAVSGVSLTIWDVSGPEFSIAVVPHTLASTTLADLKRGARVNLEADVLARWIARLLPDRPGGGVTMDRLRDAGWEV
jgi:riboflavin synthase